MVDADIPWAVLALCAVSLAQAQDVQLHPNERSLTVWEGDSQRVYCSVTTSENAVDLSWAKEPTQGGSYQVASTTTNIGNGRFTINRTLEFKSFSQSDEGVYTCTLQKSPVSAYQRQIKLQFQSKCESGKYGIGCMSICNEFCTIRPKESPCDYTDGSCRFGCQPGYMGIDCSSECEHGKYGVDCASFCGELCKNISKDKSPCHHVTGDCKFGCQNGYTGVQCSIAPADTGSNTGLIVGVVFGVLAIIGFIIIFILYRKYRERCKGKFTPVGGKDKTTSENCKDKSTPGSPNDKAAIPLLVTHSETSTTASAPSTSITRTPVTSVPSSSTGTTSFISVSETTPTKPTAKKQSVKAVIENHHGASTHHPPSPDVPDSEVLEPVDEAHIIPKTASPTSASPKPVSRQVSSPGAACAAPFYSSSSQDVPHSKAEVDRLTRTCERQASEIETLKVEIRQLAQSKEQETAKLIAEKNQQIEENKKLLQDQLKDKDLLYEQSKQQMAGQKEVHDKELAVVQLNSQIKTLESEVQQLKQEKDKDKEHILEKHKRQLESFKNDYEQCILKLKESRETYIDELEGDINQLREKYNKNLTVTDDLDDTLQQMTANEVTDYMTKMMEELKRTRDNYESKAKADKNKMEELVKDLLEARKANEELQRSLDIDKKERKKSKSSSVDLNTVPEDESTDVNSDPDDRYDDEAIAGSGDDHALKIRE